MSTVAEVVAAVRRMSEPEGDAVRRVLDELGDAEFRAERARATRDFHSRGLTDDDIDRAVEQHCRESRP
jgi:hypothetical protein